MMHGQKNIKLKRNVCVWLHVYRGRVKPLLTQ